MDKKTYLGGGVYIRAHGPDGDHAILETSDGTEVTNTIYLNPTVQAYLINYLLRGSDGLASIQGRSLVKGVSDA